jgi:hypothetical protein
MIHPLALFFAPILLLSTEPPQDPDFSDLAECEVNESEIAMLQLLQVINGIAASELKEKQVAGTISEEENASLFLIEIRSHQIAATISLLEYQRYYCRHPERRPEIMIDPDSFT